MNIKSYFIQLYKVEVLSTVLTILLVAFSYEIKAQNTVTGAMEGTVVNNKTGEPIKGVSVRFINEIHKIDKTVLTDEKGRFFQGLLPFGGSNYTVQFSRNGYQPRQFVRALKIAFTGEFVPVPVGLEPISVPVKARRSIEPIYGLIKPTYGSLAVASLPNSTVIVESLQGGVTSKSLILAGELLCIFDRLPVDKYKVTAELEGYQTTNKEIVISANKTVPLTLNLIPNEVSSRILNKTGRYYALIIGGNDYQYFSRLKTAEADAIAVDSVLREKYEFETKLLLNASREQIIVALNEYKRKLEPNSNLLIYYAGHGYNQTEEGAYWIPVNARKEDNANWISADDITRNIKLIPAKHILVVSDSCYSGALSRSSDIVSLTSEPTGREKLLLKMSEGKSRTLLASGGDEPVLDGGGGGKHSVFANAFLSGLAQTDKKIFTAEEFYIDSIKELVAGKANQNPEYSAIRNSGHESGGFIFIRRK